MKGIPQLKIQSDIFKNNFGNSFLQERINREKYIIIFNLTDSQDAHQTDLPAIQNTFTQCRDNLPFDVKSIIRLFVRLGRNFFQGKINYYFKN